MSDRTCSVADCADPAATKGFCRRHYFRFWYYGDPLKGRTRKTKTLPRTASIEDRFWVKVCKGPSCWEWIGATDHSDYGQFSATVDGQRRWFRAHRLSYEMRHDTQIPADMTIDHLCRNPSCVNPDHLEVVTQWENNMRNRSPNTANAKKTHCKRGHPLFGANVRIRQGKYGPNRSCKACDRLHSAAARHRRVTA